MPAPSQPDIQTLIANAACIACAIPPGEQMAVLLSLIWQLSQSGAVTGGGMTCGAYGVGSQPNFTPASGCAGAINTDDGRVWWYYSGQWN